MPRVETDIEKRWEQGCLHDERTEDMLESLLSIDNKNGCNLEFNGSQLDYLMSLLDIYFEMKDITSTD